MEEEEELGQVEEVEKEKVQGVEEEEEMGERASRRPVESTSADARKTPTLGTAVSPRRSRSPGMSHSHL